MSRRRRGLFLGGFLDLDLDPDTQALIDAMTVTPSTSRQLLYDDLIRGLKTDGLFTLGDVFHIYAAHDAQAATLNILDPATFTAVPNNSPTFTVDVGFTTDGSTNFVDTGYSPTTVGNNYAQDSASFGFFCTVVDPVVNSVDGGWFDTTNLDGTHIRTSTLADTFSARINNGGSFTTGPSGGNADGSGFWVINRSGAAAVQAYRNGSAITLSDVQTSVAPNADNFRVGSDREGEFKTNTFRAHWSGGSLTAQQAADLNTRLQAFFSGL